jgi:O-succinylbenzoate synthase
MGDRPHRRAQVTMIRIERIELREISLPLTDRFRTSAGSIDERRILLLELHDADGSKEWSECVAETLPTYAPDTVDTCWLAISKWIAPIVVGESFDSPELVDAALSKRIRGHRMARAAVEMGLWAVFARKSGVSLAAVLNDRTRSPAPDRKPRSKVESGVAFGIQPSPELLADRCRAAAEEGYRRIRIKIAPDADVTYVRAANDALESRIPVAVDGNCAYSLDNANHVSALEALDSFGLSMIEQPLGHDDLMQHATLQRCISTPLCLDESITGVERVAEMIALESARIVNLKPGRVGGFRQSLAIHDACAEASLPLWCGGMLETGIGRAYNIALASLPQFTLPGDLSPSARYWAQDIVEEPWTMDAGGRVKVPLDRKGIGVEVNEELVDQLTVRRLTLGPR